jgi:hypothetical protein
MTGVFEHACASSQQQSSFVPDLGVCVRRPVGPIETVRFG